MASKFFENLASFVREKSNFYYIVIIFLLSIMVINTYNNCEDKKNIFVSYSYTASITTLVISILMIIFIVAYDISKFANS
jgi:SNF family Na+-dependent transporter